VNDIAPVPIGSLPQVGEIPSTMHAQVVRQERFGEPLDAFKIEEVPVPRPGRGEVLIGVMAAGINYNNVFAARGAPIDVIAARQRKGEPWDFHVGGSDASGIVWAVGEGVTEPAVGDVVVVHPGWWDADDKWVLAGRDPMLAPSAKIWGYNTNFGSFGQFAIAQAHQCLPKAPHLTWAEAAAPSLVGTTVYRMLYGWSENALRSGDLVLVWGGSGGLGIQAIQVATQAGAKAVAVVSEDRRGQYCVDHGAIGYINRTDYTHWGVAPHWSDQAGQKAWMAQARRFKEQIATISGGNGSPDIVFEHPGEATIPTSVFVCAPGGMVVICAGTSGYSASLDLRYHWVMQKRLQGSHGSNDEQARKYNDLVIQGKVQPGLGEVISFEEIGRAHQDMSDGREVFGSRVALVGAASADDGRSI
jgi:crotonyl-CoA carboxylase/reductase